MFTSVSNDRLVSLIHELTVEVQQLCEAGNIYTPECEAARAELFALLREKRTRLTLGEMKEFQ